MNLDFAIAAGPIDASSSQLANGRSFLTALRVSHIGGTQRSDLQGVDYACESTVKRDLAMIQPLNFFAPFESLAAHHENQLTRALLVVLRYSPLAHATWLNLIAPHERLERLPAAEFRTQKAHLVQQAVPSVAEEAPIRGISVFLAPDAELGTASVKSSDRTQILDGIIQYGDELVVAVENKITAGALTDQPTAINTHGVRVEFGIVQKLPWQSLLEAFADLSARGLVSVSELKVIDDFLEFAEHYFPQVGPYSTLRRAANSVQRVRRRLDNILAAAVGISERPGQGEGWRDLPEHPKARQRCVEMTFLGLDEKLNRVVLRLFPGDTLSQSRALYPRAEAVRGLLLLDGWGVKPNFHWGFRTSGYCWSSGRLDTARYVEHWIQGIASTGAVRRNQWEDTWLDLEGAEIVSPEDKMEFDTRFTNTNIQLATPRPGLVCEYSWSMDEAMVADDTVRFVDNVRRKIVELLNQLQEPLLQAH